MPTKPPRQAKPVKKTAAVDVDWDKIPACTVEIVETDSLTIFSKNSRYRKPDS